MTEYFQLSMGLKQWNLHQNGKFGVLAVLKNGKLDSVSLEDVVGNNKVIGAVSGNTKESNLRRVSMDDDLVKTARNVGISLGDQIRFEQELVYC